MTRSYVLDTIGWAFSFTMFLVIYIGIKKAKFHGLGYMMYPEADFNNLKDVQIATEQFNSYIHTLYFWLPVTLGVDIGIRYLIKTYKETYNK
jgi:hypothetical protein